MNKNFTNIVAVTFLLSLLLITILRTSWISDDAAITLRSVMNFTHGFGPVFNVGERVQAYTHTLWFIVLTFAYLIFGHIYYSTIAISIITVLASLIVAIKYYFKDITCSIIFLLILFFSQAFIDYSTSGLENPLSFLLISFYIVNFAKITDSNFEKSISTSWLLFFLCSSTGQI
ncbi:hypothetical protein [Limisalsivibrio acetivorans]|uniref:hypothetical protein n=1 Tax=Limisalsivibrio acetivorans TaxID=1304888 RepID=UPI0012DD6E65|nr:hypothetical protein [Limisalsivibrio acetivorans]